MVFKALSQRSGKSFLSKDKLQSLEKDYQESVKSLKSEVQSVRSSKIAPSIAPSKPLDKIEEEKEGVESSPQKTVASITPTILDQ